MTRIEEEEPPGWSELCAKLRIAKNADEFQVVLDQINRLLTAHEKAHHDASPRRTSASDSEENKEKDG
jgi:hypothetical protein